MSDETPTSGNRWEPDAQAQPAEQPAEQPARSPWRPSVPRNRAGFVGAAALLLVVSGGGGFAVGRATAEGHDAHRDFSSDHRGFGGPPAGVRGGQLPPPPPGLDDDPGQGDQ